MSDHPFEPFAKHKGLPIEAICAAVREMREKAGEQRSVIDAGGVSVEVYWPISWPIEGRAGRVYSACYVGDDVIKSDLLIAALLGHVIPGRGVVRGVERFCTYNHAPGQTLGLLIVPEGQ